ncbi:MAG: hypothetical protein DWQ07_14135 [Chloroflexi bacterium]|nr:MAG: hypothetical protein DWQ07_14135 [Chloroflexota bacterium]
MAFTYDVTTDAGKVRMLVGDKDTDTAENQIFTDAEIDAFLAMEENSIKRAAASALLAIANNQVYVLKVMKTLDMMTDGAKMADSLRAMAEQLRKEASEEEAWEEGGAFDFGEQVFDDFSARERLVKEQQRSG